MTAAAASLTLLVVLAAGARCEQVVVLPPYTVETNAVQTSWQYARLPGVEVLSRCSDPTTLLLLEHHFRLRQLLMLLLPEEFQVRLDVPEIFVLFNDPTQAGVARELIGEFQKQEQPAGNRSIRAMSNYRFWDRDAVALFFVLDELSFSQGRMTLTPEYFRFLMENRTPALPPWFVEGMLEVYRTALVESGPPRRTPLLAAGENPPLPDGVIAVRPARWVSEAETLAVREDPRQMRELLPLAALFSDPQPEAADAVATAVWRSQAALFIRWALDGGSRHPRREALWKFVRCACRQPATEGVFQECFGLDYDAVRQELGDYLPAAVRKTLHLRTAAVVEPPVANLRRATDAEVSRLKGGLDRQEIAYVKRFYPQFAPRYIAQARRTLRRAYDQGDRDPRLLAEMGLCECDAGDDAAARPFLEAAVQGRVVRPRARYELARIYFQELLTTAPGGKLTVAEAGKVLQPLAAALRQSPPLAEEYELIAEVWLRAESRLSLAQLDVLDEGIRLFPVRTRLLISAALLNSLQGRGPEARILIQQGLGVVTDPREKEQLLKLLAAIDAPAVRPGTE